MITIKYANLDERKVKSQAQEALGLRMLHDNFDADWKPGDESHGTMIFTDEAEVVNPWTVKEQKRQEAKARAVQAIKANAATLPWGKVLADIAIAQGWIEPV